MKEHIQLFSKQIPSLKKGTYSFSIEHSLKLSKDEQTITFKPSAPTILHVQNDRFNLDVHEIHTVFPPANSISNCCSVLPHICLKNSFYPWERKINKEDIIENDIPSVALLLFTKSEIDSQKVILNTIPLSQINGNETVKFPLLEIQYGENAEDPVKIIDVQKKLLTELLPSVAELKLLNHVRCRGKKDESMDVKEQLAITISNRIPYQNSAHTACLVSLEERFVDEKFDYQQAEDKDYIRLVCLYEWSFQSSLQYKISEQIIEKTDPDSLHTLKGKIFSNYDEFKSSLLPMFPKDSDIGAIDSFIVKAQYNRSFLELINALDCNTLRLPKRSDQMDATEKLLNKGYLALPHSLKQGDFTFSWYHSPLSPCTTDRCFSKDIDIPNFADDLVRYHSDEQMFDMSYATAYTYGRMLALADQQFSEDFLLYKSILNQRNCVRMQQEGMTKIIETKGNEFSQDIVLQEKLADWLANLALLHQIPVSYLIPSEEMLPTESIRFFTIDKHWLEALLYGACSIGERLRNTVAKLSVGQLSMEEDTTHDLKILKKKLVHLLEPDEKLLRISADAEKSIWQIATSYFEDRFTLLSIKNGFVVHDNYHRFKTLEKLMPEQIHQETTGCLLRSEAVTDWPDLRIEAFTKMNSKTDNAEIGLRLLRKEQLSNDILLFMFQETLQTVNVHLEPEGLHFALEQEKGGYVKKNEHENSLNAQTTKVVHFDSKKLFKNSNSKNILDIEYLATALISLQKNTSLSSACFGLHLFSSGYNVQIHLSKKS
jgi:hypothetical protein